jgi:hypothetical protein
MKNALAFNPEKGEKGIIGYTISESGIVSIKVKASGTRELFLATIVNWEKREAGSHTEYWDGRDYGGNLVDPSSVQIIVEGEPMSAYQPGSMELKEISIEDIIHGKTEGHYHGSHHAYADRIPDIDITSVHEHQILSGMVLIESVVSKEKRGYGNIYGYGVRYYLDRVQIAEEFYKPDSDGCFNYRLDTTAFQDGEHLLSVGMCDHHEHVTSKTYKIIIKNH